MPTTWSPIQVHDRWYVVAGSNEWPIVGALWSDHSWWGPWENPGYWHPHGIDQRGKYVPSNIGSTLVLYLSYQIAWFIKLVICILWYITLYVVQATHMYFKWDWVNSMLICTCMYVVIDIFTLQATYERHSRRNMSIYCMASSCLTDSRTAEGSRDFWLSELNSSTVFCMCIVALFWVNREQQEARLDPC